jgi:excisionase family DNA binding protein
MEVQMELITLRELAKKLKLSERQIYNLVKQGKLPHVRVGGVYRFDFDAVMAALRGENETTNRI